MAIPTSFLDELRSRTTLSTLIGRAVKLQRAGREWKACCPFHNEKTPSFTINDDKGMYHCFGCGAHGDAIRWLTEHDRMEFLDAVRQLAEVAGMEVPAPTPEAQARAARIDGLRPALEAAQALYGRELEMSGAVREYLLSRGIDDAAIATFGLGWAPTRAGHLKATGITFDAAIESGLAWQADGRWGETFRGRVMIPVHDARGRLIGFGGRSLPLPWGNDAPPKYKNSPDSEIFDKGRTLFNLHRAAPASREAGRLIVVEGYMDVIALARIGIAEAVAPMGTALTAGSGEVAGGQLERLWRVHPRPILAFDGDAAGRKAAVRTCQAALPHVAPGRGLAVALFPAGQDPDDVARTYDPAMPGDAVAQGRAAVETVLMEAVPIARLLFDAAAESGGSRDDPEAVAGVWAQLDTLARTIRDEETRAQYLATWRARFDREVSMAAPVVDALPALHVQIEAEGGGYHWPEERNESERRLIQIVTRIVELRRQRSEISESIRDALSIAKVLGFAPKSINAVIRDIEADPDAREEGEAIWALYRRVLGIRGPMNEAILPDAIDPREIKVTTAANRRLSKAMVMIDAREGPAALPAPDGQGGARHG